MAHSAYFIARSRKTFFSLLATFFYLDSPRRVVHAWGNPLTSHGISSPVFGGLWAWDAKLAVFWWLISMQRGVGK